MSLSKGLPPARETLSLNNSTSNAVVAVAVQLQKNEMPNCAIKCSPQAIALANNSASASEKVHHLYAQMHSLIDKSVNCASFFLDS